MACGYDECGMDCVPGCTGCGSGCGRSCTGACSGCGSCGSGCSGCSGCGGACSKNCTSCTGACSSACDNGCTAAQMAEFYEALGTDFVIDRIIQADDANDLVTAVGRELARRGLTGAVQQVSADTPALSQTRDAIRADLEQMGFVGTDNPGNRKMLASEVKAYANYLKTLYQKNLKD